jgi:integrase
VRKIFKREVLAPLDDALSIDDGEVDFTDAVLHSLRHSFVSQAFLAGASESEIREWVGHADSRIIERYRHLSDTESKRRMAGLDLIDDADGRQNDTT